MSQTARKLQHPKDRAMTCPVRVAVVNAAQRSFSKLCRMTSTGFVTPVLIGDPAQLERMADTAGLPERPIASSRHEGDRHGAGDACHPDRRRHFHLVLAQPQEAVDPGATHQR